MRGNNYSTVGVNEQKDMVNSGVRGTKDMNLRSRWIGNLLIYCIGTSGDFVASARRLRFLGPLRTRAGSTVHYAIQELV